MPRENGLIISNSVYPKKLNTVKKNIVLPKCDFQYNSLAHSETPWAFAQSHSHANTAAFAAASLKTALPPDWREEPTGTLEEDDVPPEGSKDLLWLNFPFHLCPSGKTPRTYGDPAPWYTRSVQPLGTERLARSGLVSNWANGSDSRFRPEPCFSSSVDFSAWWHFIFFAGGPSVFSGVFSAFDFSAASKILVSNSSLTSGIKFWILLSVNCFLLVFLEQCQNLVYHLFPIAKVF